MLAAGKKKLEKCNISGYQAHRHKTFKQKICIKELNLVVPVNVMDQ